LGLILDPSIIIAAERLSQTAYQMIEDLCALANDLAHGIYRANTPQRRTVRQQFLDDLLAGMPVHPVNISIAMRAGRIDGNLQAKGLRVALTDLLIGATALELGYSVLTHNVRHFETIPGAGCKTGAVENQCE
jgi:tRNA(fMet)-specific endonuclease VapC